MMAWMLANSGRTFWMPEDASTLAAPVDGLFRFILGISVFFFFLILVLMIVFIIRYRHREGAEHSTAAGHSTVLELTWTIIPTILVVIIFIYGFRGYMKMAVAPADAYEIQVTGSMWTWSFTYPNGHVDAVLHVPPDQPVRLVLTSMDVIHSVFIPAFRVKKDAVPQRYNRMWFQATRPGEYDLYCAEYCGTAHSQMITKVVVHNSASEFREWLREASNLDDRFSPIEAGKILVERFGCLQCHSLDGSIIQAPSFKDLFGSQVQLDTGRSVTADEAYIRESILMPQAKIVRGFPANMPSFQGRLTDRDINAIIMFLKSNSAQFQGSLEPPTAPADQKAPATAPVLDRN